MFHASSTRCCASSKGVHGPNHRPSSSVLSTEGQPRDCREVHCSSQLKAARHTSGWCPLVLPSGAMQGILFHQDLSVHALPVLPQVGTATDAG